MNKKIKITLMGCLAVITLAGCEDLTDVPVTMPSTEELPTGGSPSSQVGARSASVSPSPADQYSYTNSSLYATPYFPRNGYKYDVFFQYSVSPEFPDDSTRTLNRLERKNLVTNSFRWQLTDLQPSTTYYYREVYSDGLGYVYGETGQFTTTPTIYINSIAMQEWNQETATELPEGNSRAVGIYYGNGNTWYLSNVNAEVYRESGRWYVPYYEYSELLPEEANGSRFYFYAPYNSQANDVYVPVDLAKSDIDVIFGSSQSLQNGEYAANITMRHALALVTFQVAASEDNAVETSFYQYALHSDSYSVPYKGNLYLASNLSFYGISRSNLLTRNYGSAFRAEKTAKTLTFLVIPTSHSDFQLQLIPEQGRTYTADIPAGSWEADKAYSYDVKVTQHGMTVGDVYVTPWTDIDGGNILVTN